MWWIVDNVGWVLLFLALVAAGLGKLWLDTRKSKLLLATGCVVALMAACYALSLVIVTDRMQLSLNIDDMRTAINAGRVDEAMKHFSNEIKIKTSAGTSDIGNAQLLKFAKGNMSRYAVNKVITGPVHVDELQRPNATVRFAIRNEDGDKNGWCIMKFHYDPDGKWRVQWFTVESLIGGHTAPVLFPF